MADGDLGTARGKIVIDGDYSGIDAGTKKMDTFGKKADETGKKTTDLQPIMQKTSTGALVAGGLIAAGFAVAAKSASDFATELSAIQAVSGATTEQMKQINDAALRIGKDTVFSAKEAAQAMTELAKAGVSIPDILNGAADATVALAAAGGVALPEAATIAANAMNQFALSAQELPKVADTIAGAANASAIDVSQFGFSLAQVGAVAKLAGVNFHDTATAIAVMGNAGVVGSDAGTSLKSMFLRLNPQTQQAADLMKSLGIITADGANKFYDQTGKMKNLASVSQVLQDALKGMTDQQKQATLTTLFGSDAIRGAAILAGQGAEGFNKMADALDKVKAADVAKTRMNNLSGSIEQLKGSMETLMIIIGQALIPTIKQLVDSVTTFFNWMLDLPKPIIQAGVVILGIIGTILLFIGVGGKLALMMMSIRDAMLLATGATTLFGSASATAAIKTNLLAAANAVLNAVMKANPILLIISLIAGLVAAIITLTGSWKDVGKVFQPVADKLKKAFTDIVKALKPVASAFADIYSQIAKTVAPVFKALAQSLLPPIMALLKALVPLIDAVISIFMALVKPLLGLLVPAFQLLGSLITIVVAILQPFINILSAILVPILNAVAWVLQLVADGIQWLADQLNGFFNGGLQSSMTGFGKAWDKVYQTYLKPFWDNIVKAATPVVEWLIKTVQPKLEKFAQLFGAGWEAIKTKATEAWTKIQEIAKPVVDWFITHALPLIKTALDDLNKGWDVLKEKAGGVWQKIQDVAKPVIDWLVGTALPAIKDFVGKVELAFSTFKTNIEKAFGSVATAAQPALAAFDKVRDKAGAIWDKLVEKAGPVVTKIQTLLDTIKTKWDELITKVQPVMDKFAELWQKLQDKLQPIFDKLGELFGKIMGLVGKIFPADDGAPSATEGKGQRLLTFLLKLAESSVFGVLEKLFDGLGFAIDVFGAAFDGVAAGIQFAWDFIIKPVFDAMAPVITAATTGATTAMQTMKTALTPIWDGIKSTVKTGADGIGTAIDGIKTFVDKVPGFFSGIKEKVQHAFDGAKDWLKNAGENIMQGLHDGIQNAIDKVKKLLQNVTGLIPSWKGPMDLDKVLLKPNGKAIMQSLISGLQSEVGNLHGFLGGLNVSIPNSVNGTIATAGGAAGSADRTLIYHAAPGSGQLDGEADLFTAMKRSKVVVPGW